MAKIEDAYVEVQIDDHGVVWLYVYVHGNKFVGKIRIGTNAGRLQAGGSANLSTCTSSDTEQK